MVPGAAPPGGRAGGRFLPGLSMVAFRGEGPAPRACVCRARPPRPLPEAQSARGAAGAEEGARPGPRRAPGAPPRQMVGPDDAGAPGGAAVLPAGRQEAAEEEAAEEEDGERDGSRGSSRRSGGPGQERLLQRYLAAAGKRCPEKPANGAACALGPCGRMTNGDVGFLLQEPPPRARRDEPGPEEEEEEEAKLQNGGFLPCPAGGVPSGTALEEPLRSCRLQAERRGGAESPSPPRSPGGDAGSRTCRARAEPLGFTDVNLNSRNTYEVSRRRSAPEHLPHGGAEPAPAPPPQEPADRARHRAGIAAAGSSFAEFFTRYRGHGGVVGQILGPGGCGCAGPGLRDLSRVYCAHTQSDAPFPIPTQTGVFASEQILLGQDIEALDVTVR